MFVIGLYIINWAFISEKTKESVHYLAQNIRLNKVSSLEIKNGEIYIKQYHTVTYLGRLSDEALCGESMALKVINQINSRLGFLYRKNRFLSTPLRRLLCNSLIQPHFDYVCSAWYPNLNKKLESNCKYSKINAYDSV